MSKRKAVVNDIIYELDNDDLEISSEDEAREAKINRLDLKESENTRLKACESESNSAQTISVDLLSEEKDQNTTISNFHNGGKISPVPPDEHLTNNEEIMDAVNPSTRETESEVDSTKKVDLDGSKTTIYNEDIIIDSPASNSDLGVVGCENRIPLITVRFRDRNLASSYKNKLKAFMLRLIKLHDKEPSPGLDSETDIELDIWPEDLNDEDDSDVEDAIKEKDNLFFIDTDPCSNKPDEIPRYQNVSTLISNHEEKEPSPPPIFRRGPTCFNCEGAHQLRDCSLPKNSSRIAENRKQIFAMRVGRYHVEDEQKYGHLIPGRISGQLRHALGLKRHELPLHIYRMRLLGYPPGWLEEARISHSGITMFDSSGAAILDPEDEEGEVCEPGSKDKFDIKKILDFPGFNVPASSRYKEEGHQFGLPPMSEQDSKIAMLQMLAPNAMKAYKRKKLTLFPSASNNVSTHEVAEMELDSGDEIAEFPSVPPLPDDVPPLLPPPPPPPPDSPEPEPAPPGATPSPESSPTGPKKSPLPPEHEPTPDKVDSETDGDRSGDDLEVIEVIKVKDIPIPEAELITIDDDDDDVDANTSSGRGSPSLDDLEQKKRLLLSALEGDEDGVNSSLNISSTTELDKDSNKDDNKSVDKEPRAVEAIDSQDNNAKSELTIDTTTNDKEGIPNVDLSPTDPGTNDKEAVEKLLLTPESKAGHVKTTSYGTPVMNIASPYDKLPSDDKFAKDITDVINFENLPNSTGKYKQICNILKRVKTEVDRIQES